MNRKADLLAVDMFCGAGGASTGLVRACDALGISLSLLAINHWPTAVQTHLLNHPNVRHKCEAIERIDPRAEVPGGRLHLLLAGPECTHFSTARAAMSFPKGYVFHGKREEVVRQIGNAWPGELALALCKTIAVDYAPKRRARKERAA